MAECSDEWVANLRLLKEWNERNKWIGYNIALVENSFSSLFFMQ